MKMAHFKWIKIGNWPELEHHKIEQNQKRALRRQQYPRQVFEAPLFFLQIFLIQRDSALF